MTEALDAAWTQVKAGHFGLAVISGGRGTGRSTTAATFAQAKSGEAVLLTAHGGAATARSAFGVWDVALESHLGVAEPAQGPVPSRQLAELASRLHRLAASDPLLVVLDDAHWVDDLSWELMGSLSRRPAPGGILVVACLSSVVLLESAAALRLLEDLGGRGLLTEIELGPLSHVAVRALVERTLGGPVDPDLVTWLERQSAGNPLLLDRLVTGLTGPSPRVPDPESPPVAGVRRAVRSWTAEVSKPSRQVAEVLAVANDELSLSELSRILGVPGDDLVAPLDELVKLGLAQEQRASARWSYAVAAPAVGACIYADLTGARRTLLHRGVASAMLERGRVAESTRHFLECAEAGDTEAFGVLLRAVEQTDRTDSGSESLALLGVLGELLPSGDPRWAEVADVLSGWGFDHWVNIDVRTAISALREIEVLPASRLAEPRRAAVKGRLGTLLAWDVGELDGAARAIDEAIVLYRSAGMSSAARLTRLEAAYIRGLAQDVGAMAEGALEVLASAEASGDDVAAERALALYCTAAFFGGSFAEAESAIRRAISLAREAGRPHRVKRCYVNLGWMLSHEGRMTESFAAFDSARAADPGWAESSPPELEADARLMAGDVHGALACVGPQAGPRFSIRRGLRLSVAALCHTESGEFETAERVLSLAREAFGGREWFIGSAQLLHAAGVTSWAVGREADAVRELDAAANGFLKMGAPVLAMPALLDLVEMASSDSRFDVADRAVRELTRLAEHVDRPLYGAAADLARAIQALAGGGAADAAQAATPAVKVFEAGGARLLHGRSLAVLGLALGETNSGGIEEIQEAARILDAGGALWRRDRVLEDLRGLGGRGRRAAGAVLGVAALTPREREVAQLVAMRLPVREVAERLFLSPRTVESHLAGAYNKLGVHSKADLVRVLGESA